MHCSLYWKLMHLRYNNDCPEYIMKEKRGDTVGHMGVSRVDSNRTHGFFARIYRGEWVGPKSFADQTYGGRENAEAAAWRWWRFAEDRLPVIPPKPVLKKATFRIRKGRRGRYYEVYLPRPGKGKPQSLELYFNVIDDMEKQAKRARQMVERRNAQLLSAYQLAFAAWKRERERIMKQILSLWTEVKGKNV